MKSIAVAIVTTLAMGVGAAEAATLNTGLLFSGAAPEASTWAMLIMGFGAAGAVIRRRRGERTYRLVERAAPGQTLEEEFAAPDDACALLRAASVASGEFQVWRGNIQVR